MAGRRLSLLVAIALVLGACGQVVVPTATAMPDIATSVTSRIDGRSKIFTVANWPLDGTVAFLCRRAPGAEFTPDSPHPAESAGCLPVDVLDTSADSLQVRFDPSRLDATTAQSFVRSGPWQLALAGRRGPLSAAISLTIIDSPIPSDPGPS
jgi:hypothetical protein